MTILRTRARVTNIRKKKIDDPAGRQSDCFLLLPTILPTAFCTSDYLKSTETDMQRFRTTDRPPRPPRPGAPWLAGMLIGATVMTMAAQAMILGAGAAVIRDATLKDR
jgi:hypothetical protein